MWRWRVTFINQETWEEFDLSGGQSFPTITEAQETLIADVYAGKFDKDFPPDKFMLVDVLYFQDRR